MKTSELHSQYEPVYAAVKHCIDSNSAISPSDLIKLEEIFKSHPQLLLYSPVHDSMTQVNYQRLEVDSIAYLLLHYNKNLGYKAEAMPAGFLQFIKDALTHSLKDKDIFENFLLAFLSEENPLVKDNSRLDIQQTNLSGYKQMVKEIMLSEHFSQLHMESILIDALKGQKDYLSRDSMSRLFSGHDYAATELFLDQLGAKTNDNEKFKSLLADLLLSPINEKLIKNNAAASILVFLSKESSAEYFKKACLSLIKEISPHINRLDARGNSFAYYIQKGIKHDEKRDYAMSVLNDFGAVCISPSITNKFMETIMGFCTIFMKSNPKPAPVSPLAPADVPKDINNSRETQRRINQLDFSKFTDDEGRAQGLKEKMLSIYQVSQNILNSPLVSTLEMNDMFFVKKDILENFLISTFELTKSLSSFASIGPSDTQKIFEPWLEQLNIIELRLNKLDNQLKINLIQTQTREANINLKVLKAKA